MKRFLKSFIACVLVCVTTVNVTAFALKAHSDIYVFDIGSTFLYENANWGYSEGLLNIQSASNSYKYGYVDTNGKTVIDFSYDEAEPFSEGYAVVCRYVNGSPKYGYIDKTGKLVVPYIYDYAMGFSEGYAAVGKYSTEKYITCGFINTSGTEVVPLQYVNADFFSNGLARVSKDSDNDGYPEFGYINTSGDIVIPITYTDASHYNDSGYTAVAVTFNDSATQKWGYIDKNGTQLTQFLYDFAGDFEEGYAAIGIYSSVYDYYAPKFGFLNTSGRETISPSYSYAYEFSNGLSLVSNGSKYGYINNMGSLKISYNYNDATSFSEGLAAVCVNSKWGYINDQGQAVTEFIYDKASKFSEGFATVVYSGKTMVISNPTVATEEPEELTVSATNSNIFVNGQLIAFEAYTINGYNYFKLRDLAAVSNGTKKQFEVTWNSSAKSIELLSKTAYTTVGGELGAGDMKDKIAVLNTSPLYINGKAESIMAYTINGNNYFKLRDICQVFDIGVTWNGATNSIGIDHDISYTD